jgi:hypothetical protein
MPINPDIRRRIKARLLDLSPRAFELFAGDLLVYVGLQNIAVTRYVGDGGIDAQGDLLSDSGLVCVPTGVQVKRHRQNVQRSDIERFIGALSGQFHHGIFITTASYARQAQTRANTSPLLRVDTINGEQIAALMLQHSIGLIDVAASLDQQIDSDYFDGFEAQVTPTSAHIAESSGEYHVATEPNPRQVSAEEDLISLRALSYALRVDMSTVRRNWVESGKLQPDRQVHLGSRSVYYFRRDRTEAIRRQFVRSGLPTNPAEWRQEFLDYASSRNLTRSYKPVLLRALIKLVNQHGEASLEALAAEFHDFYLDRQQQGLITETDGPLATDLARVSRDTIRRLLLKYPLDRFILKGFLEYDAEAGLVRFNQQIWQELRVYELLEVQARVEEQLRYYYGRLST